MAADITFCIVPRELAGRLHEPLRRHFAHRPDVEVIVERRGHERRGSGERRAGDWIAELRVKEPGEGSERRRVRNLAGRRVGERRAELRAVEPPADLPRRARPLADRLLFVRRVAAPAEREEDLDVARTVARIQAGDREAFSELYLLYFDRVYAYLRMLVRDPHEAEDLTQQVFAQVLEAIGRYEQRGRPFRAYLFTAVRNLAIGHLRRAHRLEIHDPGELARRREDGVEGGEESVSALDWISDRDLVLFVERLPLAQRQILLMRFMLDLSPAEIGQILGRSTTDVRVTQSRAIKYLRQRLAAVGRAPKRGDRTRARTFLRQAPVLRGRRFVLMR